MKESSDFERSIRAVKQALSVGPEAIERLRERALEGVVVEYDRTRLPQAFIECTTEYDYAELPDYLRADLERWCDVFRAWDQSKRREEGR